MGMHIRIRHGSPAYNDFVYLHCSRLDSVKNNDERINFQSDVVNDMAKESNYGYDVDARDILHSWKKHRSEGILTYRDHSFTSRFTGTKASVHQITFMDALDDSVAWISEPQEFGVPKTNFCEYHAFRVPKT